MSAAGSGFLFDSQRGAWNYSYAANFSFCFVLHDLHYLGSLALVTTVPGFQVFVHSILTGSSGGFKAPSAFWL